MNYLSSIIEDIKNNRATLFVGAGMSTLVGLPAGNELSSRIKVQFPKIDQELSDFMEICEDVISVPPYNKQQLQDFVRKELYGFTPSKEHISLTSFDWNAIFTTNYDNVIESAYQVSSNRARRCIPYYTENPNYNILDREVINLFKIMGCVNGTGNDGEMILTTSDYHAKSQKRHQYLKSLFDFVKSGSIIYVGYSFKDKIASTIIKEVKSILGEDKLPYSYMLLKDGIPQDERSQRFFNTHKIIPIHISIEEFCKYLETNYASHNTDNTAKEVTIHLNLHGKILNVDEDTAKLLNPQFTLLNEDIISNKPGDKDDFIMGRNHSWAAWKENWDFIRDKYDVLLQNILEDISSSSESINLHKITGMPGAGKSFVLQRLSYDLYTKYNMPVLYYNNLYRLDFKAITSGLEKINDAFDASFSEENKSTQLQYIFAFDNASTCLVEIQRLRAFLTSRGRKALFILCDRESEWTKAGNLVTYSFKSTFIVEENTTNDEFDRLIDYLYKGGYILQKNERIKELIKEESNKSFFATIYTHVHPSRKPLDEIIKDQFSGLGSLSQSAYKYICCFNQYNIPINIEWLVRILECSYANFVDEVLNGDATKIIFKSEDVHNNQLFSSHHRIIAKITLDTFVPNATELYDLYLKIFSTVNLSNNIENDLCERLLIDNFSDRVKNSSYSIGERVALFKAAITDQQTRALLHHMGLLEASNENFAEAEKHFKEALEIENTGYSKGESDQNILTSLGVVYSKQALKLLSNDSSSKEGEELVAQAELCFNQGKHGDYPNVHAYHSHAYHWYSRGKAKEVNDPQRIFLFSKALGILTAAKDNLNDDDLQIILELEQSVWAEIGIEENLDSISDLISTQFNSANGYYLAGLFYFQKAIKESSQQLKDKHLKNAFSKTSKALKKYPNDAKCLELRCKIYKMYNDYNMSTHYDMLELWYNNSDKQNVTLLYEYARASFCLNAYDKSYQLFQELQIGLGVGHNARSKQRDIIQENGRNQKFYGKISDIYSSKEGFIISSSFSSQNKIKFIPISANYTAKRGDYVKFEIAFGMRGPIAINVSMG